MTSATSDRTAPVRPSGRRRLLLAVLLVAIGSFMPWLNTALGSLSGARGAGLWTFYAAMLGLAGALIPRPRISGVHAAVFALVAVALPAWQLVHVLRLVGFGGWMPGPGMVLVVGGGVLAGVAAKQYLHAPDSRG